MQSIAATSEGDNQLVSDKAIVPLFYYLYVLPFQLEPEGDQLVCSYMSPRVNGYPTPMGSTMTGAMGKATRATSRFATRSTVTESENPNAQTLLQNSLKSIVLSYPSCSPGDKATYLYRRLKSSFTPPLPSHPPSIAC